MKFPLLLFGYLFIQLLGVSYIDIKFRKISNYWSLLNIGLFILGLIVFPDYYKFALKTFFYPVAFLGVTFVLFAFKIMGGGDSKYLFSFFLLVPESHHEDFMIYLLYTTVVIGFVLLIYNTIRNFAKIFASVRIMDLRGIKSAYGTKFAYAPVILISWIVFGWTIKNIIAF